MTRFSSNLLLSAFLAFGVSAQAQEAAPWSIIPAERESAPAPSFFADRDALGLPGQRPRLTMTLPLDRSQEVMMDDSRDSTFSWSLETWQLNTASLAHIQCNSGRLTMDTYLAQDCRFIDQPLPDDSVNLVQLRGDWMATPSLTLGIGAFHSQNEPASPLVSLQRPQLTDYRPESMLQPARSQPSGSEGLDFNVSFGIQSERVGDILVGLQLARYRQRMSLTDLGLPMDHWSDSQSASSLYANSAQLVLGWRRGSFSGEMLGQHREVPLWLSGEQNTSPLNSFDLEFSWHALQNASISVGVSNVLDTAPAAEDAASEPRLEDPMESVYGRIPYVRYKHDL